MCNIIHPKNHTLISVNQFHLSKNIFTWGQLPEIGKNFMHGKEECDKEMIRRRQISKCSVERETTIKVGAKSSISLRILFTLQPFS